MQVWSPAVGASSHIIPSRGVFTETAIEFSSPEVYFASKNGFRFIADVLESVFPFFNRLHGFFNFLFWGPPTLRQNVLLPSFWFLSSFRMRRSTSLLRVRRRPRALFDAVRETV